MLKQKPKQKNTKIRQDAKKNRIDLTELDISERKEYLNKKYNTYFLETLFRVGLQKICKFIRTAQQIDWKGILKILIQNKNR